jgi:DNA primase
MINSPIEEIKSRLDIVDVVKDYIKIEKAGINYRALCPFHSEKTPSFFISPSRQMWHCFGGCGKGGDIFKFVMEIEGVEFSDALRILAARAGVELKRQDPKEKTERQRIYEIAEWATRFFEKQLEDPSAKEVLKYLLSRGIKEESIKEWRIGYSCDSWSNLIDFLSDKGYSPKEIEKAGLAVKKENSSGYYDRFRDRIIFPIFDLSSQPVGFGGRIFDPKNEKNNQAKYLNTSNTLIYDKSRILYGLDKARSDIRKKECCVLVEGYTDAIMSYQAGITNVVATSGTALTQYQLKTLKRYCDNLITAFDMDIAGESATKRGIDLAQSEDFNIKLALMPKDSDPADLIKKDSESWEKIINEAVPIISFYFQSAFSKFDSNIPENKKKIARIVLPVIKRLESDIEKDFWIQKLSEKLEVKESAVIDDLEKIELEEIKTEDKKEKILNKKNRNDLLEERLLISIIKKDKNINLLEQEDISFLSDDSQKIINYLRSDKKEKIDENLKEKIDYLGIRSDIDLEKIDCDKELKSCLLEINIINIKKKLSEISNEIKKAEQEKDSVKVEKLKKEFNLHCQQLVGKD